MGRRFFRYGELHLVLLVLLGQQPMHGYQLLTELERLFGPEYRPSPGSVYPAIESLEEEGLIAPDQQGGRTVYQLTGIGERAVRERTGEVASIEARTGTRIRGSDRLDGLLARFEQRVRRAASHLDIAIVERVLEDSAEELEDHREAELEGSV